MSDEPQAVELGAEPDEETIRACVEAIRSGGKVKPLAGCDETLLHAVVRYANGLPFADTDEGRAAYERVNTACAEPVGTFDDPTLSIEQHAAMMFSSLTYASEFLLAASLPDPVERLGAIIGIALVTQPDGFETGPETREHLNLIADFVRTLAAHPELIADALEQLRETGEEE